MTIFNNTYFDAHQTNNYFLSGQVDLTGFSFAITNIDGVCQVLETFTFGRAIVSHNDWAQELDTIFRKEPLLKKKYKLSSWVFLSDKSTLIPELFFAEDQLKTCLNYTSQLNDLDEVHHWKIYEQKAMCVFAVPSTPANIISKYQPNARFLHQQIPLFEQMKNLKGANRALLNVSSSFADVLIFADNKLVLTNTYPVSAFTDVLYNLTFALKTHNLLDCNLTLYCTGILETADENLLRSYYKDVKKLFNKTIRLHIGEKNATAYYSLLTLAQCE